MNILIVYATYSGGTQQVVEYVAEMLRQATHEVTVERADVAQVDDFKNYGLVLLASPSWEDLQHRDGRPHQYFIEFIERSAGKTVDNKPFATIGLGDREFAHFAGAVDHLETWVQNMKGKLVMPSLRINRFYFNETESYKQVTEWVQNLLKNLPGNQPTIADATT